MTYCVAIKVDDGLVFAGDTRTSAGVDDVRTYNKLHVIDLEDRVFVLLSAGNLATTQAVVANIRRDLDAPVATMSLRLARYMFDAAEYVGSISVRAQHQIASQAQFSNADLRTTFILGGQIRGEEPAIYLVYPEGNCISSSPETPFLQIGESKYGKPILDRVIRPEVQLEDAARCALVSLDSTMRSNISVGPPIDLAILPTDSLKITHKQRFDLDTPFYARLRESWGHQLVAAFRNLPKFDWEAPAEQGSLLKEPASQSQQAANG